MKAVEFIQYVDVMSLYPFVCKYFKFPVGHPLSNTGDTCRDKESMLRGTHEMSHSTSEDLLSSSVTISMSWKIVILSM